MKRTLRHKSGLRVELDRSRIVPDDPGQDTPAMVYFRHGRYNEAGTYNCALDTGELCCGDSCSYQLTDEQNRWLESIETEVNAFLAE